MFVNFSVFKGDMWPQFNNLQNIGARLALYFYHGKRVLKLGRKKEVQDLMAYISLKDINWIKRLAKGYFLLNPQQSCMIIIKDNNIYCVHTLSTVAMIHTEINVLAP